ncbi:MAG: putative sulfate exporter family transporter [Firmicutes bacterium]|nr:putative sulfate exporter family transporter [Bacillota bacterium]
MALVTVAAQMLGRIVPVLGPAISGMILGLILRNVFAVGAGMETVTGFCSKRLLKFAVVLVGATFTLQEVAAVGGAYLIVILSTIAITLGVAFLAGRFLGVPRDLARLIGVGTAICGATAILTVGPVVRAKDEEIAYAISTVFLFNVTAMVLYPVIGQAVGMDQAAFGAWAGASIHDTSSVLAAAFGYGDGAGAVATVVKLTRTLFLIPLVALFTVMSTRSRTESHRGVRATVKAFPTFILGFLAMSFLSSVGVISAGAAAFLGTAAKFLVVVVLAAVGLSTDLSKLRRLGARPLFIGLAASLVVAAFSGFLLTAVAGGTRP